MPNQIACKTSLVDVTSDVVGNETDDDHGAKVINS